jgi:hypothetical protein
MTTGRDQAVGRSIVVRWAVGAVQPVRSKMKVKYDKPQEEAAIRKIPTYYALKDRIVVKQKEGVDDSLRWANG